MHAKRVFQERPVLKLLLSSAIGLLIFVLLLVISAFSLTKHDQPDWTMPVYLFVSVFFGALTAGFICKRKMRNPGIIPVLVTAGCYVLPILIMLIILNLSELTILIPAVIPAALLGAFPGGLAAEKIR